jgi:alpha-aminoadipate carrier protein LysW
MAICTECDVEIDVDELDVNNGDQLSCPECGSNLVVVAISPIKLDLVSENDDSDDEDAGIDSSNDDDEQA